MSVESELADYKQASGAYSAFVLKISQDIDNILIPTGTVLPEVAKLRIFAAQLAGASTVLHPCAH